MVDSRGFFTDGAAYERMMGRWSHAAGHIFLDWLALPPGLKWLDAGCGTGALSELVLGRCKPRVIEAIDPSEDQIAYARTKPAAKHVRFEVGDAQSLPFGDARFDVAAMALVITFIADPAKALAEFRRVVKPGGTVATYVWDFLNGGSPQQPLREAIEATGVAVSPTAGHKNSTRERLEEIFTAAALDDVATRMIEIEISYPDFEAYWTSQTAFANSVVQHLRTMKHPDLERVQGCLRKRLPTEGAGRIVYKAWANAARGRVPG